MAKYSVTADAVVEEDGQILLIRRSRDPFKDEWALPGGHLEEYESLEDCAIRETKEETGVDIEVDDLIGVYDAPDRDPRGRVISAAYKAEYRGGELEAASDAGEAEWWDIDDLPSLAFDHDQILEDYKNTYRS